MDNIYHGGQETKIIPKNQGLVLDALENLHRREPAAVDIWRTDDLFQRAYKE
jgi:hypothetical protein